MIEIHAVALGVFVFAFIVMACCCAWLLSAVHRSIGHTRFWRERYETLNAKVRPAFNDAAENLVPMTSAAHERLEKLKQALDTKDAAS